jgi:predicted DNA-binding protein
MSTISFRISNELKEKMKNIDHINWSEILRKAIEQAIENEAKKKLALAVLLNERFILTPDEGWKSTEEIRRWREIIRWK